LKKSSEFSGHFRLLSSLLLISVLFLYGCSDSQTKSEPKSETIVIIEVKPEANPEVKFQSIPETNSEVKIEVIPQSKPEVKPITVPAPVTSVSTDTGITGFWITTADKTGKDESIVQIYETNNKYYGKIIKTLQPEIEGIVCYECRGEDKDKPIVGLMIVKGLKEKDGKYTDGTILDPWSGNTYDCSAQLDDNGKTLKIRGSLAISIFGKNEYWRRTTQPDTTLIPSIKTK